MLVVVPVVVLVVVPVVVLVSFGATAAGVMVVIGVCC